VTASGTAKDDFGHEKTWLTVSQADGTPGTNMTVVTVSIDDATAVSTQIPSLAPTAIVGFTGSTGGLTDVHIVRNALIITG